VGTPDPGLLGSLARFVLPAALVTAGAGVGVYALLYTRVLRGFSNPDLVPAGVISDFESYTGLSSGDTGFTEAAATIGAQTGLSTFVSLAAFVLVLFLEPPSRFFASWTAPSPDKRPAILVAGLVVAFGAVLFTPALSNYFGLTGPAEPVFETVLPALVLWFVALSAAFRFRLLDRVLGLDLLPRPRPVDTATDRLRTDRPVTDGLRA
jgi:cation-transporting P-type ATPase E